MLIEATYINSTRFAIRYTDLIYGPTLPLNRSMNMNEIAWNKTTPVSQRLKADLENFSGDQIHNFSRSGNIIPLIMAPLIGSPIESNVSSQNTTMASINGSTAKKPVWDRKPLALNNSLSSIVVSPGDSIQAAIDRASPGDLIEVRNGTYFENIRVNKPLVLRGLDSGKGYPIIDGSGNGNTIEISARGVTIEDLIAVNSSKEEMASVAQE
jgi:pectin methylesterase-like acyl-CoA thioesterase